MQPTGKARRLIILFGGNKMTAGRNQKKEIQMKKIIFTVLLVSLSVFSVQAAHTQELIAPFGSLEWSDTITEALIKIQNMQGLEKVEISYSNESVDAKNTKGRDSVNAKLSQLLKIKRPRFYEPDGVNRVSNWTEKYTAKSGAEKRFIPGTISIKASPINISGVPFNLEVNFTMQPGIDIVKPDQALYDNKINVSFPCAIEEVILMSEASSLADKFTDINTLILNKYKKFDKHGILDPDSRGNIGNSVSDLNGDSVYINSSKYSYFIRYNSISFPKELDEAYRKHLAEIENKKNAGKQDMGSSI